MKRDVASSEVVDSGGAYARAEHSARATMFANLETEAVEDWLDDLEHLQRIGGRKNSCQALVDLGLARQEFQKRQ